MALRLFTDQCVPVTVTTYLRDVCCESIVP